MNNVFLSILIAVYNEEKYLERVIESILSQTFRNYEIILVNDGSTDGSLEICRLYEKNHENIRVVDKENGGLGSARLAGLKAATGKCVAFVDADDYVESDFFEKLCEPIIENNNIDIVIGTIVREEKEVVRSGFEKTEPFDMDSNSAIYQMLSERYFKWTNTSKIFKKELFDGYFDWPESYGEDMYTNWKIFQKASMLRYVPASGYHYCLDDGSLMRSGFKPGKSVYFDIWKEIADWAYKNNYVDILKEIVRVIVKDGSELVYEAEKDYVKNYSFINQALELIKHYIEISNYDYENRYTGGDLKRRFEFVNIDVETADIRYNECVSTLRDFCSHHRKNYIYGAGKVAKEVRQIFMKEEISCAGYIVSKKDVADDEIMEFDAIRNGGNEIGIIVGLNKKNSREVRQKLIDNNVDFIELGQYVYYYE